MQREIAGQRARPIAPGCPGRRILSAYLDGEVEQPWEDALRSHVGSCGDCRRSLLGFERVQSLLAGGPEPDAEEARERVRRKLVAAAEWRGPVSVWQRHVSLPLPVVGLAATVILLLCVSLFASLSRSSLGLMSIKTAPSGLREVQITASAKQLEQILKTLEMDDAAKEEVIRLPAKTSFGKVNQPAFFRERDLGVRKP